MQYYGMQRDILEMFAEAQMPPWRVSALFAWMSDRYARVLTYNREAYEEQCTAAKLGARGSRVVPCPHCNGPLEIRQGSAVGFHFGEARLKCFGARIITPEKTA